MLVKYKDRHHSLFCKAICLLVAFQLLLNDISFALAPTPGSQSPITIRETYREYWERTGRLTYRDPDHIRSINNGKDALAVIVENGAIIASAAIKGSTLKVMRAVVHEQVEAIMQIMARHERAKYSSLINAVLAEKDLKHTYFDIFPDEDRSLPDELLANHIIARAFELIISKEKHCILKSEMTAAETKFLAMIEPLVNANKHNWFTGVFFDDSVRDSRIRIAMANGMRFIRTASTGTDDASAAAQEPGSYFSADKLRRYAEGPDGIFKDSPEIADEIRQAFAAGAPRIVNEGGDRKIEINVPQMHFLNWYERRFGLIPKYKPTTFMRGYIHDLFHLVLYQNGFVPEIRKALAAMPQDVAVNFLNEFNQLFGVLRDPSGDPVTITGQYLTEDGKRASLNVLLEEIGAKYMSGMYEDEKLHPVYAKYAAYGRIPVEGGTKEVHGLIPVFAKVIEEKVDGALKKISPRLSLFELVNSELGTEEFIVNLEHVAYVNAEPLNPHGVVIRQDKEDARRYAGLKRRIKGHKAVADLPAGTVGVPVGVTWSLGFGDILGDWMLALHTPGEFRFSTVCDAVESAIYTDANGMLSSALKGMFGDNALLSSITAIEISPYQEGAHAGIFQVSVELSIAGVMKRGSFIVYASRSEKENEPTVSHFENLGICWRRDPRHVCRPYGRCRAMAKEGASDVGIEIFADEKLEDFWEVNALLRRIPFNHDVIAPGEKGMGFGINKGGVHRSKGEKNAGGAAMEAAIKEEIVRVVTAYSDIENGKMLVFTVNAGDFLCRLEPGKRPAVKLSAAPKFERFTSHSSLSGRELAIVGACFMHILVSRKEVDVIAVQPSSGVPRERWNEYSDYLFDPKDVFKGVLAALIERYGPGEGAKMMREWLQFFTLPAMREHLNSVSGIYRAESVSEAQLFMEELDAARGTGGPSVKPQSPHMAVKRETTPAAETVTDRPRHGFRNLAAPAIMLATIGVTIGIMIWFGIYVDVMGYLGKDYWHYVVFRVTAALLGHKIASYADNDTHRSRYALAAGIELIISAIVPFYYGLILEKVPDLGLWSHSLRPLADLFIFSQPLTIGSFCLFGLRNMALEKSVAEMKKEGFVKSAQPYLKAKIRSIYGKDGFMKISVLFWVPVVHFLYYSQMTVAERVATAGVIVPFFAAISAAFLVQKPGRSLTGYPALDRMLRHSYKIPIAIIPAIAAIPFMCGDIPYLQNVASAYLTVIAGYYAYKAWNAFLQRYVPYLSRPEQNAAPENTTESVAEEDLPEPLIGTWEELEQRSAFARDFCRYPRAGGGYLAQISNRTAEAFARKFLREKMKIDPVSVTYVISGTFCRVIKCTYVEDGVTKHLAVNVSSLSPDAARVAQNDFDNLTYLHRAGRGQYVPKPYAGGWVTGDVSDASRRVFAFAVEWLDGYDELLMIRAVNGGKFLRWRVDKEAYEREYDRLIESGRTHAEAEMTANMKAYRRLSRKESDAVAKEIVKILAYYYDPEHERSLANIIINSGDFNFRELPGEAFDIKLITTRWMKEGVPPKKFLEYLLNFSVLDEDSPYLDGRFPYKDYPRHKYLFRAFSPEVVYEGLREGLVERHGEEIGLRLFTEMTGTAGPAKPQSPNMAKKRGEIADIAAGFIEKTEMQFSHMPALEHLLAPIDLEREKGDPGIVFSGEQAPDTWPAIRNIVSALRSRPRSPLAACGACATLLAYHLVKNIETINASGQNKIVSIEGCMHDPLHEWVRVKFDGFGDRGFVLDLSGYAGGNGYYGPEKAYYPAGRQRAIDYTNFVEPVLVWHAGSTAEPAASPGTDAQTEPFTAQEKFARVFGDKAGAILEFLGLPKDARIMNYEETPVHYSREDDDDDDYRETQRVTRRYILTVRGQPPIVFYGKRHNVDGIDKVPAQELRKFGEEVRITDVASPHRLAPKEIEIIGIDDLPVIFTYNMEGTPLSEMKVAAITPEMVEAIGKGLGRLHSLGIRHGDINGYVGGFKWEHIFLRKDRQGAYETGFIDYGMSVLHKDTSAPEAASDLEGERDEVCDGIANALRHLDEHTVKTKFLDGYRQGIQTMMQQKPQSPNMAKKRSDVKADITATAEEILVSHSQEFIHDRSVYYRAYMEIRAAINRSEEARTKALRHIRALAEREEDPQQKRYYLMVWAKLEEDRITDGLDIGDDRYEASYMTLCLTNECTAHCDFCFSDSSAHKKGRMTVGQIERALVQAKKAGIRQVRFQGGEPTLVREEFLYAVRRARELGLEPSGLNTNGGWIEEPWAEDFIKQLKAAYQLPVPPIFLAIDKVHQKFVPITRIKKLINTFFKLCPRSHLTVHTFLTNGGDELEDIIEAVKDDIVADEVVRDDTAEGGLKWRIIQLKQGKLQIVYEDLFQGIGRARNLSSEIRERYETKRPLAGRKGVILAPYPSHGALLKRHHSQRIVDTGQYGTFVPQDYNAIAVRWDGEIFVEDAYVAEDLYSLGNIDEVTLDGAMRYANNNPVIHALSHPHGHAGIYTLAEEFDPLLDERVGRWHVIEAVFADILRDPIERLAITSRLVEEFEKDGYCRSNPAQLGIDHDFIYRIRREAPAANAPDVKPQSPNMAKKDRRGEDEITEAKKFITQIAQGTPMLSDIFEKWRLEEISSRYLSALKVEKQVLYDRLNKGGEGAFLQYADRYLEIANSIFLLELYLGRSLLLSRHPAYARAAKILKNIQKANGIEREYHLLVPESVPHLGHLYTLAKNAYLVVGEDMISSLDDDSLAGVIGHELAHCVRGHSRKHLQAMATHGDYNSDNADFWSNHHQADEREADSLAFDYAVKAGYRGGALIRALEVCQTLDADADEFIRSIAGENTARPADKAPFTVRTHPPIKERVEALRRKIDAASAASPDGTAPTSAVSRSVGWRMRDLYSILRSNGDVPWEQKSGKTLVRAMSRIIDEMKDRDFFRVVRGYDFGIRQLSMLRIYRSQYEKRDPKMLTDNEKYVISRIFDQLAGRIEYLLGKSDPRSSGKVRAQAPQSPDSEAMFKDDIGAIKDAIGPEQWQRAVALMSSESLTDEQRDELEGIIGKAKEAMEQKAGPLQKPQSPHMAVKTKVPDPDVQHIEITVPSGGLLEETAFTESLKGLEEVSWKDFGAQAVKFEGKAAVSPRSGQSLILYADDILKNAMVVDIENTFRKALSGENIFRGGKIVLYAKNAANAVIVEKIIHRADPALEVVIVPPERIRPDADEVEEADILVRAARAKDGREILAIIRGPSKEPAKLAAFAKRSNNNSGLPIIIVGPEEGIYSFAQAVAMAIEAKANNAPDGWLIPLSPIRVLTDDIRRQYDEYKYRLQALVAA